MTELTVPPHSIVLEQEALGIMSKDQRGFLRGIRSLTVSSFYKEAHQLIFDAFLSISKKHEDYDGGLAILREELIIKGNLDKCGGATYLVELSMMATTSLKLHWFVGRLETLENKRKIMEVGIKIDQGVRDNDDLGDLVEMVGDGIGKIKAGGHDTKLIQAGDVVDEAFEMIEAAIDTEGLMGIPSGFRVLDNATDGFQKTDLIIIAGLTGMGKSSLALNIAGNVVFDQGKKCGYLSLEMGNEQLVTRLAAQRTHTNMRSRKQKIDNFKEISQVMDSLRDAPLWFTKTSTLSALDVKDLITRQKKERGLDLLIIDYLQLLSATKAASKENRQAQVTEMTRTLKCLAKDLETPIICLSQLNREFGKRKNPRPVLRDLRDSGSIEQDADVVIFIYRPDYHSEEDVLSEEKGVAEIIIKKQRNGRLGTWHLGFKPETCNFYNLE